MTTPLGSTWTDDRWEREIRLARPHADRAARRYRGLDPGDLLQESLIGAWRSRAAYDGRGSIEHWLGAIVARTAASMYRAKSARPESPAGFVPDPSADARDEVLADSPTLDGLIGRLSAEFPAQGEVVALARAGLHQREIAAVLTLSLGAVKMRRKRGLATCRAWAKGIALDIASNHGSLAR